MQEAARFAAVADYHYELHDISFAIWRASQVRGNAPRSIPRAMLTNSENNVAMGTRQAATHHGKNNLNTDADTTAFNDTWVHAADTHASTDTLRIRRTMPEAALRITLDMLAE
jgi:hypothetical protein